MLEGPIVSVLERRNWIKKWKWLESVPASMAYLTETKNIVSVWERERWKGKMTHYLMQAGCDAMTCGYIARSKPCGNSSSINLPCNHSTQSSLTCIILQAYSNVSLTDNNLLWIILHCLLTYADEALETNRSNTGWECIRTTISSSC